MTAYNHSEFHLTHQRAEITDEERRLIDEAIAKGKVQTIPQGKSAFEDEEYIWEGDPNNTQSFGKLVLKNPMTREEALRKYKRKVFKPNRPVSAEREFQRKRVLELATQEPTLTKNKIAEKLGMSLAAVKRDFSYLQGKGLLAQRTSSASGLTVQQVEARRAKVKELRDAGVTKRAIAERLGCGIGSVDSDIRALRERGELQ